MNNPFLDFPLPAEIFTLQAPSPLRGEPFDELRAVSLSNGVGVRVNDPIPFSRGSM
jgi:hypothetical protein